jgi:hypothetical protein
MALVKAFVDNNFFYIEGRKISVTFAPEFATCRE